MLVVALAAAAVAAGAAGVATLAVAAPAAASPACATGTTYRHRVLHFAILPFWVDVVDYDGDGNMDVVAAGVGSVENKGGFFDVSPRLSEPQYLFGITARANADGRVVFADVDGDGAPDGVTVADSGSDYAGYDVRVWFRDAPGDGDAAASSYADTLHVRASGNATAVLVGDVQTVVMAPAASGLLYRRFAHGPAARADPAPDAIFVRDAQPVDTELITRVEYADVDRDGVHDLVLTYNALGAVRWLRANHTSDDSAALSFDPRGVIATLPVAASGGTDSTHVLVTRVVDVDGDGDVDVVLALSNDDTLHWAENVDGAGNSWRTHTIAAAACGCAHPMDVVARDVDGDGVVELLVSSAAAAATVLMLHSAAPAANDTWTRTALATNVATVGTATAPFLSVALGDADNDGAVDALWAAGDGVALVRSVRDALQRSGGGGSSSATTATPPERLASMVPPLYALNHFDVCDVDGDGVLDLVALGSGDFYESAYASAECGAIFVRGERAANGAWHVGSMHTFHRATRITSVVCTPIDTDDAPDVLIPSYQDYLAQWVSNRVVADKTTSTSSNILAPFQLRYALALPLPDGMSRALLMLGRNSTQHYRMQLMTLGDDVSVVNAVYSDATATAVRNIGPSQAQLCESVAAAAVSNAARAANTVDVILTLCIDASYIYQRDMASDTWQLVGNLTLPAPTAATLRVFDAMLIDLDNDGELDATYRTDQTLWVQKSVLQFGTRPPATAVYSDTERLFEPTRRGAYTHLTAATDYDHDGNVDLLVGTNNKLLLLANERGDASTFTTTTLRSDRDRGYSSRDVVVRVVDIDGDGDDDVVYTARRYSIVGMFENTCRSPPTTAASPATTPAAAPGAAAPAMRVPTSPASGSDVSGTAPHVPILYVLLGVLAVALLVVVVVCVVLRRRDSARLDEALSAVRGGYGDATLISTPAPRRDDSFRTIPGASTGASIGSRTDAGSWKSPSAAPGENYGNMPTMSLEPLSSQHGGGSEYSQLNAMGAQAPPRGYTELSVPQ